MNTKLTIEKNAVLKNARKTTKKLSKEKLMNLLKEYEKYQNKYGVEEQRIVHMTINEILMLNPDLSNKLVTE